MTSPRKDSYECSHGESDEENGHAIEHSFHKCTLSFANTSRETRQRSDICGIFAFSGAERQEVVLFLLAKDSRF